MCNPVHWKNALKYVNCFTYVVPICEYTYTQMASSVKLLMRKDKCKRDGTCPVYIRITANRKTRYLATGISVEPKYWNSNKEQIRASHEIAPALNAKLKEKYLEAEQVVLDSKSASAAKAQLTGTKGDLLDFMRVHVQKLKEANQFWRHKQFSVTLNKLERCFGKEIPWTEMDHHALAKFEKYLRVKVKNGTNTIRKDLQRLHRIFRLAIKDGVVEAGANPFLRFDIPGAAHPATRIKLSISEIEAIEALDLPEGSSLRIARDAFLVAFYGSGMRWGDVCNLRKKNIRHDAQTGQWRLVYRMLKNGRNMDLPLPSKAISLLEPYLNMVTDPDDFVLPILKPGDDLGRDGKFDANKFRRKTHSRTAIQNGYLKKLAAMAELQEPDRLSTHVARHSFADLARTRGNNLYATSKTLGHSDLKTTQKYLKAFDREAVDQLAEDIWG